MPLTRVIAWLKLCTADCLVGSLEPSTLNYAQKKQGDYFFNANFELVQALFIFFSFSINIFKTKQKLTVKYFVRK